MVRFQLRAEALRRDNPWAPQRQCWHVARVGAVFALCARMLEPATSVRSIRDAECIPESQRCAECWEQAFDELRLPA